MKIAIYFLSLALLIITSGCSKNFLNKDNPTATTDDKWWKLETDLTSALDGIYGGMPSGTLANYNWVTNSRIHLSGATDETVFRANFGDWQLFPLGLATSGSGGSITAMYQNSYIYIRNASRFLEHYQTAYVEDASRKERYASEARALRAWYHLDLFRLYGPIPIVDHSIAPDDQYLKRNTQEEVVSFIAAQLDSAAIGLPASYDQSDAYRMSKGTCYAMKAILYMNTGDYASAKVEAKKVIDLGVYSLYTSANPAVNSYAGLFSYDALVNTEAILYRRAGQVESFFREAPKSLNGQAANSPTLSMVDTYETLQGKTIQELGPDSVAVYEASPEYKGNRDPRLKASVIIPGETFVNRTLAPFDAGGSDVLGGIQSTQTGFWIKKYVDPKDAGCPYCGTMNFMIIRYAEILLDYVESLIETGDMANPDIYTYLNRIRQRAGMPAVDQTVYNTQDMLRTLVRRERQVELAFEGQRLFDIRRWKIGPQVLNGPCYGAINPSTGQPVIVETRLFNADKDYVWPIPLTEINGNPNMKQNPNW